jgi:hypothetical protein
MTESLPSNLAWVCGMTFTCRCGEHGLVGALPVSDDLALECPRCGRELGRISVDGALIADQLFGLADDADRGRSEP